VLKKNDFQLSITEILHAGLDLIVTYAEEREVGTNPLTMKAINEGVQCRNVNTESTRPPTRPAFVQIRGLQLEM
jgi:hypothetical protein